MVLILEWSYFWGGLKNESHLTFTVCQDNEVYELARDVIEGKKENVIIEKKIKNEDRTFGATLSYFISM